MNNNIFACYRLDTDRVRLRSLCVSVFLAVILNMSQAISAPGTILFSDDFNSNLSSWTINNAGGGDASIGTETSNSGNKSLRMRWNTVVATTNAFNAAVPGADFTVWIRRGADNFSEDPDFGEDLIVQYLNNLGLWTTLETLPGNGTPGEILNRTYTMPADALHALLQLRFTFVTGSGGPPANGGIGWDYWHIDDVVVTETAVAAALNCDTFESGFNWTATGVGSAGVSSQTFNSPGNSMFLRWDTVTVVSPVSDFSTTPALDITVWIRRGADSFSEDPDNGEDLVLAYLNNLGLWIPLETFSGNGAPGQIFNRSYTLPADALHANFQLRFVYLRGSGPDFDYWHVDDVCYVTPLPSIDHFAINHDTTAINCQAEPITITAHNADHSISTAYAGTLNLSTTTGKGDWTIITGLGTLNNGVANDGIATYNMVAGDLGVVVLGLKDTTVETVNINVTDGVLSEITGTALASEDRNLAFAQSGFVFLADAVPSSITTQIGGKASNLAPGNQVLELQAIRTSDTTGACEAALQGVQQIELAFECRNPATCTANQFSINGGTATNIAGNGLAAVSNYTPVSLDFGNATDTTASFVMNYPDVGEMQLYARYNIPLDDGSKTPSGVYMSGNSNIFVERPFGFYVTAAGNPAATSAAGSVYTQAGADFTTSVTAVLYQAADDGDANGIADGHNDTNPANNANLSDNIAALNYGQEAVTENLVLSSLLDQPSGGIDPGLQGGTTLSTFVNGVASSNTVRFDEVGIIEMAANLADNDYLGIGAALTANIAGKSGYVGRFIPSYFVITSPLLTNRSDIASCPDTFTYMNENFRAGYNLQAHNAQATSAITQNYIGAFAKLDTSVLADMNYGATDTGTNLTTRLGVTSTGTFVAGVAPVMATLQLLRASTPDGGYSNFKIGIAPTDSDGVALLATNINLSLDGGTNTHGLLSQTDLRYGRLNLQNTFGSELNALSMKMTTEYYLNATAEFVTNVDDSCTTRSTADVLLYNDQEPKAGRTLGNTVINIGGGNTSTLTSISPFVAGQSTLTFSAPGVEGYVDIEMQTPSWLLSDIDGIDQGIGGPGMHCTPGLAATNPAFIAGCAANGNSVDEIPYARGNFGIFRGSDNVIYTREVY